MFLKIPQFLVAALLFALCFQQPVLAAETAAAPLSQKLQPASSTVSGARTINAPYLPAADVPGERFAEMGIFWFGKVTTSHNYADVRVGYNDSALFVMATVLDRAMWYDPTHNPTKLTSYDGFTLLLNLGASSSKPNPASFRFDAQMSSWEEDRAPWQAAFRGTGSTWLRDDTLNFVTRRGSAGYPNGSGSPTNGWAITYIIPFETLGLNEKPADLTAWGMAMVMHDRDSKGGSVMRKYWPENASTSKPSTFGRLVFGMPTYTPPAYTPGGSTTVRHKLDGIKVVDAGVGGNLGKTSNHLCDGSDTTRWTKWGNYNFKGANTSVIQNQSNPHDFPCFAKMYISFPLTKVPKGKVIVSAKLVLHTWGGSQPSEALPSLVQVSTIKSNFSESTITWNNAPLAQENVAQTWVDVINGPTPPWPGIAYEWDVSRAVAEAYKSKLPLRLALYEADSAMHSGKYFSLSDAQDWNAEGRPTLVIEWGDPQ